MKVWIVIGIDSLAPAGDCTRVVKVFSNKESAWKYIGMLEAGAGYEQERYYVAEREVCE